MDRPVQQRRNHAQADRQIAGSVPQSDASDDVQIDVQIAEGKARPFFQHGNQKVHPVVIVTAASPPGRRKIRLGRQSLDLAQDGACPLHGTGHTVARNPQGPTFQQHLRGIGDFRQTPAGHVEHAQLIGGTIAVFGGPQDTIRQHPVPLKIKHRIHQMFHHLGACNGAVLIDVAHDEHGDFLLFCYCQ